MAARTVSRSRIAGSPEGADFSRTTLGASLSYGHPGEDIRLGFEGTATRRVLEKRLDGLKRPASVGIGVVEEY